MKKNNNMNLYFNLLPLIGLIISIFLFILYFVIYHVDDNWVIVSLYCLLPIFVNSSITLAYKLFNSAYTALVICVILKYCSNKHFYH